MAKRVCILGLSTLGKGMVLEFAAAGYEVAVVDPCKENISGVKKYINDYYIEDLRNEAFVSNLYRREKYDTVVITIEDMVLASELGALLSKAKNKPRIIVPTTVLNPEYLSMWERAWNNTLNEKVQNAWRKKSIWSRSLDKIKIWKKTITG